MPGIEPDPEEAKAGVHEVSATAWVAGLSPWPAEGFGLERMHALLDRLGHPEQAFDAIHVVGTNGKSTATGTIAALLGAEGLRSAAYTSPHVSGWGERLDTDAAGFERALARVRPIRGDATQFELITAAAFADFAERGVDVAVVEAGLGGRLDATNVLDAKIVLLTNVALEHTDVLGDTREGIAREKLAVAKPGATVILPDEEWRTLVPANEVLLGGAREAAAAYLGRPTVAEVDVRLPGRFEQHAPNELRDGAHTPDAVDWLLARLPPAEYVVVVSILHDKDADAMLERLARAGRTLVATRSSNERAFDAGELATRAKRWFERVERRDDPRDAVARAHELGDCVLVTGSLYLLADLSDER